MRSGRLPSVLLAGLLIGAGGLRAKPRVFRDSFFQESGGKPTTNYNRFANWTVTRGSVDVIGKGGSKAVADFYPGNNLYVDLDGSDLKAGPARLESKIPLELTPGEYQFEFDLGGNSDGSSENSMTVAIEGLYKERFTRHNVAPPAEFEKIVRRITVAQPVRTRIVFDADGPPDYYGLIIDNVRLAPVGQPVSLATVLGGIVLIGLVGGGAAIAIVRRRRPRAMSASRSQG